MREALGQPLQNISSELLNKVVSKEVQQNLKKYKVGLGKTPLKGKQGMLGTSAEKGSPSRMRVMFSPEKSSNAWDNPSDDVKSTKEMRELLKELNSGIHDKVSLIKMLIIKCTEADSNYKKIKNCINKADLAGAEK